MLDLNRYITVDMGPDKGPFIENRSYNFKSLTRTKDTDIEKYMSYGMTSYEYEIPGDVVNNKLFYTGYTSNNGFIYKLIDSIVEAINVEMPLLRYTYDIRGSILFTLSGFHEDYLIMNIEKLPEFLELYGDRIFYDALVRLSTYLKEYQPDILEKILKYLESRLREEDLLLLYL